MKYDKEKIIEIFNKQGIDAEKVFNDYEEGIANELLDLSDYDYPVRAFSFPVIIKGEHVASIHLLELYGGTGYSAAESELLALKYMGKDQYNETWSSFSHDTYLMAYLYIHEECIIPKSDISKDFYCHEGTFKDADSNDVNYRLSYGDASEESEESDVINYMNDPNFNGYYLDEINLQIEKREISFNSLGKEINKRIKERTSKH